MKQDMMRYQETLTRSNLFRGMTGDALSGALEALGARVAHFEKGETIYRQGDAVYESAVVLEGMVVIEAEDIEGDRTNVNMLYPGEEFGACLVISGRMRSPLRVYAGRECVVLMADIMRLPHMEVSGAFRGQLYANLLHSVAEKCMDLYSRVQIYGKRRIRSRIRMYLMSLEMHDGMVELPMNRTALAAYLGVDRTALARELSRMQEEGLVTLRKRQVRLVDRDFFQSSAAAVDPSRISGESGSGLINRQIMP